VDWSDIISDVQLMRQVRLGETPTEGEFSAMRAQLQVAGDIVTHRAGRTLLPGTRTETIHPSPNINGGIIRLYTTDIYSDVTITVTSEQGGQAETIHADHYHVLNASRMRTEVTFKTALEYAYQYNVSGNVGIDPVPKSIQLAALLIFTRIYESPTGLTVENVRTMPGLEIEQVISKYMINHTYITPPDMTGRIQLERVR